MDVPDESGAGAQALGVYGAPGPEMTGRYRARNRLLVNALEAADLLGALAPSRRRPSPGDRPLRVLVANWGHLGDIVAALPILRFLQGHPRVAELGLLVGSGAPTVLSSTDIRGRMHVIDHWALDRGAGGRKEKVLRYHRRSNALVRELAREKYDVSVDLFSTFPATHFLTWRAGIPRRIGFDSAGLGGWLTDPVAWLPADMRVVEQQLRLLKPLLGPDVPASLPAAYPGFAPVDMPADFDGSGHVILHMGSGASSRDWDEAKWIAVARALRGEGFKVVATGAPGREAELADHLAGETGVASAAGRLSWAQLVTLVSRAARVVSVDTVIGHIAACFDVPCVVLTAGRQRLAYWRPNSPRALSLTHPVGCYPCWRTHGCETMACVRFIETAQVLEVLRRF